MADGSGMSRDNRASANAFIQLLLYMWKSPWREDFVSSLPYSGDPDSKFGHRLGQAPYARQVYAKHCDLTLLRRRRTVHQTSRSRGDT